MELHKKTSSKKQSMAIALSLACSVSLGHAAESQKNTQEFLSDPSRVGSLAGTILGGALTAHPVGTLAGSVVGFFVGKQSMYSETEKRESFSPQQYARRSIIPEETIAEEEISPQIMTAQLTDEIESIKLEEPTLDTPPLAQTVVLAPVTEAVPEADLPTPAPVVAIAIQEPTTPQTTTVTTTTTTVTTVTTTTTVATSPLERLASICQGKQSNLSTKALQSICYYRQSS